VKDLGAIVLLPAPILNEVKDLGAIVLLPAPILNEVKDLGAEWHLVER